jgi:hypothetical protein
MNALVHANQIRKKRASDKAYIRQRELDARALMDSPPEYWKSAHVADLLRALPGVGRTKIERILTNQKVSPSRTLEGLTESQINRLSSAIERYCPEEV